MFVRSLVRDILLACMLISQVSLIHAQNSVNNLAPVADLYAPVTARVNAAYTPAPDTILHLNISFPQRHSAEIDALIARQHDPNSPDFLKALTPAEFGTRFGTPEEDIQAVIGYLTKYGMKVTMIWPGRQSISVDATVLQAESAFKLRILGYNRSKADHLANHYPVYQAPDRPASLPKDIASRILGIFGMSDQIRMDRPIAHPMKIDPALDMFNAAPNSITDGTGMMPDDFRSLYNLTPLSTAGFDGTGQTIGVYSATSIRDDNITDWCARLGIVDAVTDSRIIHRVSVKAPFDFRLPDSAKYIHESETVADVEIILGQAPKATIVLYEVNGLDEQDIWDRIVTDNIATISDSYGQNEAEYPGGANPDYPNGGTWVTDRNNRFQQMAAQMQAHYVASGDWGAYDALSPYSVGVDFPSSSPYATGVGGTALTPSYLSSRGYDEIAMSFLPPPGPGNLLGPDGSGGGLSVFFDQPVWQTGPGVNVPGISNGKRQVPDIAAIGDLNNPGVKLWYRVPTYNGFGATTSRTGAWVKFGGTSVGAPFWAASHLLINQAFGVRTGPLNQYLYDLATIYPTTIPAIDGHLITYVFNDVTSGTNGPYLCTPGWDFVTGLGSADMNKLFLDLGQNYFNKINVDLIPYTPLDNGAYGFWASPLQIHTLPSNVTEPDSFNNSTFYFISACMSNMGTADSPPSAYDIQIDGIDHLYKTQLDDGTPFPIEGAPPLMHGGFFAGVNEYQIKFTAGPHTIKLIVNSDNKIKETNSANNTYTRTINVLDVTTPAVSAVSIIPSTVVGGSQDSVGTVILAEQAASDVTVTLTSGDTTVATVPATVVVHKNTISSSFPISVLPVTLKKTTDIKATSNGVTKQGTLTVQPLGIVVLTISPGTITGGSQTAAGSVKLNAISKSPVIVTLTSSNTAAATVPSSVTIAANQDTATFTVSSNVVASAQSISITAAYNGNSLHGNLAVSPPQILTSLTLNPDKVYGGNQSSTGTVSLSAPAVAAVNVYIFTTDPQAITPGIVTIPAGAMSVDFPIETEPVTETKIAQIVAFYNGVFVGANLTVNPLGVDSITLNPDTVRGSNTSIATVTLNGAPLKDVTIALTSSNIDAAAIPPSVVVPAGTLSATFNVTTIDAPITQTSVITAALNSVSKNAVMTVNPLLPAFAPASVTLSPSLVLGGVGSSIATVTLTATLTFPVTVMLSSSDTTAATVPSSITFTGLSATFPVTSLAVTSTKTPVISASLNGVTKSATLTVAPPVSLSAITLVPPTLISGGSGLGVVSLAGAAVTPVTVTLANSNPAAATLPASVTVPAGAASISFSIAAKSVTTPQSTTITATLTGISKTAVLTVNPPPAQPVPIGLSFNPASVVGGQQNSSATLTLSSPATANLTVTLTSSDVTAATVPASVTVVSGSSTAVFTVTSLAVSAVKTPAITASVNGGSQSSNLTVNPNPVLASIVISPASAVGNVPNLFPVVGTVTMSSAPAADVTVWVASSSNMATAQANVIIHAGTTSSSFPINTFSNTNAFTLNITFYASLNSNLNPAVTANFALLPTPAAPLLSSAFLFSSPLVGGQENATGSVSVNQVAPAGGITITLICSDPTAAAVPATVVIPQGAGSIQFPIPTLAVTSTKTVFFTAVLGAYRLNSSIISIIPVPDYTFTVNPTSVISSLNGTATVTLLTTLPKNTPVTLTSDNPNLTVSTPTQNIGYGAATTNLFWTCVPVTTAQTATLTATVYGKKKTATVTMQPVSVLTGLSLAPASIVGGIQSSTGTVTVNIPTGIYTNVTLSSDDPNLVIPPSLSVIPGDTSSAFQISYPAVASPLTAHITAVCNGVSKTAAITILPLPAITSISLSPTTVVGGLQTSTGTVTISAGFPTGTNINLISSDPTAADVSTLYFEAGATSAVFTVSTSQVTAVRTPVITADYNGISQSASLTVLPMTADAISSISILPTAVVGGVGNATGTIKLSAPAQVPIFVTLTSINTAAATVPASITIPTGSASGTFLITSLPVTNTTNASITADTAVSHKSAVLSVRPPAALTGLTITPNAVLGGAGSSKGTVTLNAVTVAALKITLSSSDITAATVPATVTVSGNKSTATFTITCKKVTSIKSVTITASYNGVSKTALLTIYPAPTLVSLTLNPTVVKGGSINSTGTVTLSASPAATATITLSSSDKTAATVPVNITILPGSTIGTFKITSLKVTTTKPSTIKASFSGASKSVILSVTP